MFSLFRVGSVICSIAITAGASANSPFDGVWKEVGYGRLYEITKGQLQTYHLTDVSCTKGDAFPTRYITRADLTEKDKLSFYFGGGITRYDFYKQPALPKACGAAPDMDPVHNFDVLWHAFNDHYAFFGLYDVNWDEVYQTFRPRVTTDMNQEALFDLFQQMLSLVGDRHINLIGLDKRYNPGKQSTLRGLWGHGISSQEEYDAFIKDTKAAAITRYLKDPKFSEAGDGAIHWGWVAPDIGYIGVDRMEGFASNDTPGKEKRHIIDRVMDQAVTDLAGAKGLIVDARWNGGGYDEIALTIAGHFTNSQYLAFTKKARLAEGYKDVQRVYIPDHAARTYTGPIAYLRGSDTFSAAEIFTLALQALPNVTQVGENTGGGFSDVLDFKLPNGWTVTMSNEVYVASNGKVYEGRGVPADIAVPVKDNDTLESYLARGMDTAIQHLQTRIKKMSR